MSLAAGAARPSVRRRALLSAALSALAIAVVGGLATDIGPWYASLKKPSWQPPDWAFGPGWTLIYAFSVWSAVTAWTTRADAGWRRTYLWLWAFNGLVNILWSVLFFRLHRPDWALSEVLLLWLSIAALIVWSARVSRKAALLLLPYIAWVTFAATLNLAVVRLNAPFGG